MSCPCKACVKLRAREKAKKPTNTKRRGVKGKLDKIEALAEVKKDE